MQQQGSTKENPVSIIVEYVWTCPKCGHVNGLDTVINPTEENKVQEQSCDECLEESWVEQPHGLRR